MRLYETAFLIAPNLPDDEVEKLVNELADVVSEKKGKMENIDNWGKRRLAYSVKKFNEAYYLFFLYQSEPDIPIELERRFKQTEAVIRYMTLKKDERENIRKKKKGAARKAAAPPPEVVREKPEVKAPEPEAKVPEPEAKAPEPGEAPKIKNESEEE